ncbi:MAG: carbamoyltransferase [Burkholderiales bacterium]|nr:carbamoyltransferase [Burkholderiales bacterium]
MRILGLSAYYHDSAAALVVDGKPFAAAQEERFTRVKHDAGFPSHAIGYCLAAAGAQLSDLDAVVFYEKPFLKFERLLETYLSIAPAGFRQFLTAMPLWLREKLFQKRLLTDELKALDPAFDPARLLFSEHHLSHAASAFYPSPFERALVLTLDGVGEWPTASVAVGRGSRLDLVKELHFPHSLGLLYSAFTHYAGFKVNSGEYKLMGLAPYGTPRFAQTILEQLVDLKEDGSFRLDQDYFDYMGGFTMTNARFEALFGAPARGAEGLLTAFHMDIAASIQAVTEEIVLKMTRALATETGERNLCMAGGVALNCVANGKILRDGRFDAMWIQPASGDAGGALGAALAAYHMERGGLRVPPTKLDGMAGSYLGPDFAQPDIEARLTQAGAVFETLDDDALITTTAEALAQGQAVGWFQGRMEFGPRALGNRSILGDPRNPAMQKTLNLRVKYRESFRPFAPAVLAEDVSDWFEHEGPSPYMLIVADVIAGRRRAMTEDEEALFGIDKLNVVRSEIPAVTHVDYSARLQTVHQETNPRFHALLSAFKAATGCPILVNTSFNVRGEPIVCTPEDAFRCFMGCDIEMLVVGNCVLRKDRQDAALAQDYKSAFELD